MNLLDFAATPLWLVWDAVRDLAAEDGVRPAESELIGLAPAGLVPGRRRPRGRLPGRSDRGASGRRRRVPPAARLQPDAGPRAAARCCTRRRRRDVDRRGPPSVVSGGPFRVIEGGRTGEPTPGLLIVGAQEIATLAGGRPAWGGAGRRRPVGGRGPGLAGRADGRGLGGPDRRGRAARLGRGRAGGRRPAARPLRPHRCGRRLGHARAGRSAHAPAVRGLARGRARPSPAGRVLPRHPRRGWRDPLDGRRDPSGLRGGAAHPRPSLARRDARATASRRSRRSPATGSTSRPSSDSWKSPTGSGAKDRSTSCRHGSAPTRSRRSSAHDRTAPRRTSATSSTNSCPGSPPTAGRGSPTSSARPASSAPISRGACSRRPVHSGCSRGSTPTSSRHRAALSSPRSSAPRRPTTSRHRRSRGSRRWAPPQTATSPWLPRCCQSRPGSS